ncbi:MAG: hypothetical protein IJ317_02765 [Clostridia bacterium]|nr:hypothetical protein [Clostridia bacterium]
MRKKILIISQCLMFAVLVIYALFSTQVFYDRVIEERFYALRIGSGFFDEENYTLDDAGATALSNCCGGFRVTFIATDGTVLGDSRQGDKKNQRYQDEVRKALELESGEASVKRTDGKGRQESLFYCKTVIVDGETALLRLCETAPSIWTAFGELLPTIAWVLALDFCVCFLFTYLQTEFMLKPVRKIAKDAALNLKVTSEYEELKPIVDILNRRNREVSEKISELSAEKELVEKAQRSKDDFIANITHEMNTPLTSIRGYAELIASGALTEEQTKEAAVVLLGQSDRLTKLIACIINYNELDDDDLPAYDVDVSELVKETLDALSPDILKKKIRLVSKIESGVTVKSRIERVNEVAGNLIRNAIRYNKSEGELVVTLCRKENGGARFSVKDTGIGIAEENLERVFDRFFTVDKSHNGERGGFGLGLAVVKKICRNSGWTINVESTFGEGATFSVDFK